MILCDRCGNETADFVAADDRIYCEGCAEELDAKADLALDNWEEEEVEE